MIWRTIYFLFEYFIFFYTATAMIAMLLLAISSMRAQRNLRITLPKDETIRYMLKSSPLTPKVSIIASAYNEEVTIIDNVRSLLNVYYPNFDIIIVNDASTDKTMEYLLDEFSMIEVPFTNTNRVPSQPIKKVYRSRREEYKQLIVVDKEHGGRKSDGINAGINISDARYFINTDVDCIVEPMAVYRMMWLVVNSHYPMMGVSATMLMSNGCKIEDGRVVKAAVPNNPITAWQQLEYMRSFLNGKMGWSSINTLSNISGGFGLFDTEVVVKSGGYDQMSMAEDVDMLLRMVTYMRNAGREFRVTQVPQVCCWTEGPFTIRMLYRQRTRWARGLCEIVSNHRKLFFNHRYGRHGTMVLPYIFFFEFLAPILEIMGFFFMLWLILIGAVNWNTVFIIYMMIYGFTVSIVLIVLAFDYATKSVNWHNTPLSYLKLFLAGITEPFLFHPFITFCSAVGYFNYIRNTTAVWKTIKRSGSGTQPKRGGQQDTDEGSNEINATPANA